jgi:hypothetical protein
VALLYVVGLTAAVGIFRLQSPLEPWHYDRHSYDWLGHRGIHRNVNEIRSPSGDQHCV